MPLYPPAGGAGGAAISAGASSQNTGTVIFQDGGGITFGLNAGTMTATVVPGPGAGIGAIAGGTQTATSGTIVFSNSNGISFGLSGSTRMTADFGSQSLAGTGFTSTTTAGTEVEATLGTNGLSMAMPNFLTTAMASNASTAFAGLGFTSTTTAGTEVEATLSTNGLSMAMPAFLTTAALSNHSHGNPTLNLTNLTGTTASNSAGFTLSLSGNAAQTNQSAIRGLGVSNTGVTAGNTGISTGIDWILAGSQSITLSQSTAGGGPNTIWFQHPAWLTTAALSADSSKYAGTGTTFNGANISGSMTMNTAGLQLSMSVAAPGGGGTAVTMYATSNTTQSSTMTAPLSSMIFAGAGAISVGVSNGSVVISGNAAAGDGVNIVSMLTSTSGGGTAGATYSNSTGSIGLMAGSNITLSQTSNTIVFNAPNSSSLVGASGISISSNGSTISVYPAPRSSWVCPDMALSVLAAMGNGSLSIAYRDVYWPVTATRVDAPFHWVQATTANANTVAVAMTVLCGIYTRNDSTLNTVSSASTQTTYTYASNSAGVTALTVAAYRPVSIPMNVNMTPGQYYMAFGISTVASSIGTATTTAAQTISAVGVPQGSSAVPWTDDMTRVTGTSVGMFSGHGIYSAAVNSVVPAISLSAINQSGSYFHRANVALIFRN